MIKRTFSVLVAFALVLSMFVISASALIDATIIYGDFNDDKKVSIDDANAVLKAAAGLSTIKNSEVFKRCDVNGDGEVTVFDARQILRGCANLTGLQPENSAMEELGMVKGGFEDKTQNSGGTRLFSSPEVAISFFNNGLNAVKANMPGFTRSEAADVQGFNIENVSLSGITLGESASSVAAMIEEMIVSESEPEAVQTSFKGENCDNAMSVETERYVSKLSADEVLGVRCSNGVTDDEAALKTVVIEVALPDTDLGNVSQTAMGDVLSAQILQENMDTVVGNVFGTDAGGDATRKTIKNCVLKAEFIVISDTQYELYRYTTSYDTYTYITNSTLGLKGGILSAELRGVEYETSISVTYSDFQW